MDEKEKNIKIRSQYRAKARMNSKQRKAKVIFLYALASILIVLVCVAVSLTILFKVETIEVVGNKYYSSEDIIKKSGINKDENIFLCSEKTTNKNLSSDFPYIDNIKLKRDIPNKIIICVNETQESAFVKFNDKYAILNSNDKVLDIIDSKKDNLTEIVGVNISDATVGKEIQFEDATKQNIVKDIQNVLSTEKLDKITQIDVTQLDNPSFVYNSTLKVQLGSSSDDISKKVNFAAKIIAKSPDVANNKGTLDASMANTDNKVYFNPEF